MSIVIKSIFQNQTVYLIKFTNFTFLTIYFYHSKNALKQSIVLYYKYHILFLPNFLITYLPQIFVFLSAYFFSLLFFSKSITYTTFHTSHKKFLKNNYFCCFYIFPMVYLKAEYRVFEKLTISFLFDRKQYSYTTSHFATRDSYFISYL